LKLDSAILFLVVIFLTPIIIAIITAMKTTNGIIESINILVSHTNIWNNLYF
ncbi:MAG: hypothetical protein RLZZ223_495, partial [Candidatus Parcubacteria bacterium]